MLFSGSSYLVPLVQNHSRFSPCRLVGSILCPVGAAARCVQVCMNRVSPLLGYGLVGRADGGSSRATSGPVSPQSGPVGPGRILTDPTGQPVLPTGALRELAGPQSPDGRGAADSPSRPPCLTRVSSSLWPKFIRMFFSLVSLEDSQVLSCSGHKSFIMIHKYFLPDS